MLRSSLLPSRPSHTTATTALAAALALLALSAAACVFDNKLDDRRCLNDSACASRFGDDFRCIFQVCQQVGAPSCLDAAEDDDPNAQQTRDEACQDRDTFFCNGLETCDPDNESADAWGCVPGDLNDLIDDGVACTVDLCDESRPRSQKVIHDASGCECQGDEICRSLNSSPCITSVCDLSTYTCANTQADPGASCDDQIDCTDGTTCDANGVCVVPQGGLNNGACDDDSFCTGVESCDPTNPAANPRTGCISGTPPAADPDLDDGIACTTPICDEDIGAVLQDPRACPCLDAADCNAQMGDCRRYTCDASTGFTCEPVTDAFLDAGSPCDDGASCTANDACRADGVCVGRSTDLICQGLLTCEIGEPVCLPGNADANPDSGCVCN